jgi:integrase
MALLEHEHSPTMVRPRKPLVRVKLPEHVHRTVARGREYFTYQKGRGTKGAGPRIRLPHPADPAFWPTYYAISNTEVPKPGAGTFAALIAAYRGSDEWINDLAEKTKVDWNRYLGRIDTAWGPLAVVSLEPKHVVALRDKFADTPAAANNLLRCLSAMVSWSVLRGWRSDNPCLIVPKLNRSVPNAPWSWSSIEIVRDRAPPELWWAAAVALYSGQRQGDVLRMKWSDIRDGLMSVVQEKTGTQVEVPVHRDLAVVLATIPKRSIFILTNSSAAPWTKDGFRTSWGRMTERLKLHTGLVFHGLRKSAVVLLLEAGCTDAEVGAITGQSRKMVEHYAQQVNRRRLAASAILKWENTR